MTWSINTSDIREFVGDISRASMLIISFRDRNFKYCPGTGPLSLSSYPRRQLSDPILGSELL